MILLSIVVTVVQIGFIAGAIYGIKNHRKTVRRIKREHAYLEAISRSEK